MVPQVIDAMGDKSDCQRLPYPGGHSDVHGLLLASNGGASDSRVPDGAQIEATILSHAQISRVGLVVNGGERKELQWSARRGDLPGLRAGLLCGQ
jgi:hypothetical protein